MPIYVYECPHCKKAHEVLQKISDAPLSTCPDCGQDGMSKQLTAAGFQLKGSGWYATDFKGGSAAKTTSTSTEPPSTAATSDSSATPCGQSCACH